MPLLILSTVLSTLRCNELAIPEQFLCSDRFNRNLQKLGVMDGFFRHSTVPTETLIGPTSSTLTTSSTSW